MSDFETVKVQIRDTISSGVDQEQTGDVSRKSFEYEGKTYVLNREEVISLPRVIASLWVAADSDVEIVKDLGSY